MYLFDIDDKSTFQSVLHQLRKSSPTSQDKSVLFRNYKFMVTTKLRQLEFELARMKSLLTQLDSQQGNRQFYDVFYEALKNEYNSSIKTPKKTLLEIPIKSYTPSLPILDETKSRRGRPPNRQTQGQQQSQTQTSFLIRGRDGHDGHDGKQKTMRRRSSITNYGTLV